MHYKKISLNLDAYGLLVSLNRKGETMSDTILRLCGQKPVTALDLFGKLKMSEQERIRFQKQVVTSRARFNDEMDARQKQFSKRLSQIERERKQKSGL
jgi:predicted CopG family antitoxin